MIVDDLDEIIENEQLRTAQIYNADENSLFLSCLPQTFLASVNEYFIEGYKESKERITVLVCSNAAATQKSQLTTIAKSVQEL